jgi:hypothetical protein
VEPALSRSYHHGCLAILRARRPNPPSVSLAHPTPPTPSYPSYPPLLITHRRRRGSGTSPPYTPRPNSSASAK